MTRSFLIVLGLFPSLFSQIVDDTIWVSNRTTAPFTPTTFVNLNLSDTLKLRLVFTTQEAITYYFAGIAYDRRMWRLRNITTEIRNADNGQNFPYSNFWLQTTDSCFSVFDTICVVTVLGITPIQQFAIPSGRWSVLRASFLPLMSGATTLLPIYLDTSELKLPIPCFVTIGVSTEEKLWQKPELLVEYNYRAQEIIITSHYENPVYLKISLFNSIGEKFTEKTLTLTGRTVIPIDQLTNIRGVLFLIIEDGQQGRLITKRITKIR